MGSVETMMSSLRQLRAMADGWSAGLLDDPCPATLIDVLEAIGLELPRGFQGDPAALDRLGLLFEVLGSQVGDAPVPGGPGAPPTRTTRARGERSPFSAIAVGAALLDTVSGRADRPVTHIALRAIQGVRGIESLTTFQQLLRQQPPSRSARLQVLSRGLFVPCGPDDRPGRPQPGGGNDGSGFPPDMEEAACAAEAHGAFRDGLRLYRIDELDPALPCPGDVVTLRGEGFGTSPGAVLFGELPSPALRWSDTEIEVVVPAGARCGSLRLYVPDAFVKVCGVSVATLVARASSVDFEGGLPTLGLTVRGYLELKPGVGAVFLPGSELTVSWYCCGASDAVRVEIRSLEDGALLHALVGGSSGSDSWSPTAAVTTRCELVATAMGACGDDVVRYPFVIHRPCTVALSGAEITQSTQYYRSAEHIVTGPSPGVDNSVRMIADKRTLVRVYLSCDQVMSFNAGSGADAVVTLAGSRAGVSLAGSPLSALSPAVTPSRDDSVTGQRGALSRSANFVLPSSWTVEGDDLQLSASLTLVPGALDEVDRSRDDLVVGPIRFATSSPPDVVIVLVRYRGPGGPVGLPGYSECLRSFGTAEDMYPLTSLVFLRPERGDRSFTLSDDLTEAVPSVGLCNDAWNALIDELDSLAMWYSDADEQIWCGVLGAAAPTIANTGCAGLGFWAGAVMAFTAGDLGSCAHEFGHAMGLPHTFSDSTWVAYNGDANSTGEYGVDLAALIDSGGVSGLMDPNLVDERMSYGSPPFWISPKYYQRVMQEVLSGSSSAPTSSLGSRGQGLAAFLHVSGWIDTFTGRARIWPAFQGLRRLPRQEEHPSTWEVALIDRDGAPLVKVPVRRHEHDQRRRLRIAVLLPCRASAVAIVVLRDGVEIARRGRPPGQPRVEAVRVERARDGASTIHWTSSHSHGLPLLHGVLLSLPGGRLTPLVRRVRHGPCRVEAEDMRGPPGVRVRVFATDGFNTAWADSDALDLPPREIEVMVRPGPAGRGEPPEADRDLIADLVLPIGESRDVQVRWYAEDGRLLGTGGRLSAQAVAGAGLLRVEARTGSGAVGSCAYASGAQAGV